MVMHRGEFAAGDAVLLTDRKRRTYLVWLQRGAVRDLRGGQVAHDAVIGRPDGSVIETSRGERMLAFRPTFAEYVLEMPRGAQVIYPKDLAMITMLADVFPGARVVEAGTGSGALTMALARAVGETGRVFSYEIREDFHRVAARNIARWLGEAPNVTLRVHDVTSEVPDAPVDRIVLDLPEPWHVVGHALTALRAGGILLAYLPTTVQVQQLAETLRGSAGFAMIDVVEAIVRPWNVEGLSVRPAHRMVAHTGFLVTARKLAVLGATVARTAV
jgi:tRNA (adenine57-N1/adenine58-N1)-methyltransferase